MNPSHPYHLKTRYLPKVLIIILFSSFLLHANFLFAQWTRKADGLRKRGECPSVLYQGKIYIFGGFGEHPNFENDNEVYDPVQNKWSLIASFPAGKAISHQMVTLVDNKIWHIGGRATNADGPVSSQVIIYNITTNTWQNGPQLKDPATGNALPLGAGGVALLGRTLHVFGGFGPTICIDQDKYHLTLDVDKYNADPVNTKWENKLAPMPTKRNHLNTVSLGGKIYAIGGQFIHDCGGADQKYVHVYDPIANTWTRLTDLPEPRSHSEGASFAIDGKIYVVGGQGATGKGTNKVFVLTPSGNNGLGSWTTATQFQLPNNFYGISAKVAGSTFIISHGALVNITDERRETYTAPFTRNTPNTFGFVAKCFSKTVSVNQKITLQNLLYTIEGTKNYTLSSNASWLKITKNATGLALPSGIYVEATIDAAGLTSGTYTGTITVTGTGGGTTFTSANFCVNLTVSGTGTGTQKVVSFTLVNADDETDIQTISDGATINLANLSTQNLNIRANTNPATVGSVKLALSGAQTQNKTENSAPYALFTESGGNYSAWVPPLGNYKLTATPYTASSGSGSAGTPLTVNFSVTNSTTSQPLVTNISSNTGRSYLLSTLRTGVTIYTDRTYKATTVPSFLNGVPLIRTPNDDKSNTSTSMLSFNLSQNATVHVGFDPRTTVLPAWLSSWQKLPDKLGIDDPVISQLDLYSKSFSAGMVSLGGPKASPAEGVLNNYIVIVKANQSLTAAISSANNITNDAAQIQVYPNPSAGEKVHIALKGFAGKETVNITMYDTRGKIVSSKTFFTDSRGISNIEIPLKGINHGLYILKARGTSVNKEMKLMIK